MVLYTQATSSQRFAHTVREGRERIIELVGRLLRSGTRAPEPDTDFDMMAVALVGAGEAVASRVSTGDADADEAAELMIDLFWSGLKGAPSDKADVPVRTGRLPVRYRFSTCTRTRQCCCRAKIRPGPRLTSRPRFPLPRQRTRGEDIFDGG